jgi:hypothetical protein
MRAPRQWLSLPVLLLQVVAAVIGKVIRFIGVTVQRGGMGWGRYVYWPLVLARRIVAGEPRWKVIDFSMGIEPKTPADEAVAASAGYSKHQCMCGEPDCKDVFWMPPGVSIGEPMETPPDLTPPTA